MSSGKVVDEMNQELSRIRASEIGNLKRKAQNEETIAAVKRRGELFEAEYARTVEEANRINRRDVLKGGVFPKAEKTATPFEFKDLYKNTAERLYVKLDAGTLPTEAEIQEEVQNVQDLILLEKEQKAEEEDTTTGGGPSPRLAAGGRRPPAPSPRAPTYEPPSPMGGGRMLAQPGGAGGRFSGAQNVRGGPGMGIPSPTGSQSDEPKYNPVYRARVSKAKSIHCYYGQNSFDVAPLAYQETAPTPEEMWYAQVGLWIQEDVVKAIADLNRAAAARVSSGDACVEDVPVKRLVFTRVLGYQLGEDKGILYFPAAQTSQLGQQGFGGPSLTGRTCNEQFDVVRFVVSVVVDQREILQLINQISKVNFYQCLNVTYEAVDQQAEMNEGYFYGTDPVVKATLEFEGYMSRDVYEELMPPAVREVLGIKDKDND
jgi:hypothetical protein